MTLTQGMDKEQINHYKELERKLMHKRKDKKSNVLTLRSFDFYQGRMLGSSFARLKSESWYIPFSEKIELRVPRHFECAFREDIERKVHRDMHKIRQEKKDIRKFCIILALIGAGIIFGLNYIPGLRSAYALIGISEVITIGAWVAVWVAMQLWITDRRIIEDKRYTLLQLLDADIVLIDYKKEKSSNSTTMDVEDAEDAKDERSEFESDEDSVMDETFPYHPQL